MSSSVLKSLRVPIGTRPFPDLSTQYSMLGHTQAHLSKLVLNIIAQAFRACVRTIVRAQSLWD